MNMIEALETQLKIVKLIDAASVAELQTTLADAIRLLQILIAAPYGLSATQGAALLYVSEVGYVEGLINLLMHAGFVKETGGKNGKGEALYTVNL